MKPVIAAAASKNRHILIETGGSGHALRQMLQNDGISHAWNWSPKNGKETRADFTKLSIERKVIHFPIETPWLEQVEKELAEFPHGKNDDYVDSITQVPWNLEGNLGTTMQLTSFPSSKLKA